MPRAAAFRGPSPTLAQLLPFCRRCGSYKREHRGTHLPCRGYATRLVPNKRSRRDWPSTRGLCWDPAVCSDQSQPTGEQWDFWRAVTSYPRASPGALLPEDSPRHVYFSQLYKRVRLNQVHFFLTYFNNKKSHLHTKQQPNKNTQPRL